MTETPCFGKTDLFYSSSRDDAAKAKELCWECPLQARCLQRALDRDEPEGVWGGYSHIERKFFVMEHGSTVHEDAPVPRLSIKLYSSRVPEVA